MGFGKVMDGHYKRTPPFVQLWVLLLLRVLRNYPNVLNKRHDAIKDTITT